MPRLGLRVTFRPPRFVAAAAAPRNRPLRRVGMACCGGWSILALLRCFSHATGESGVTRPSSGAAVSRLRAHDTPTPGRFQGLRDLRGTEPLRLHGLHLGGVYRSRPALVNASRLRLPAASTAVQKRRAETPGRVRREERPRQSSTPIDDTRLRWPRSPIRISPAAGTGSVQWAKSL
jgi:hypothetical protein